MRDDDVVDVGIRSTALGAGFPKHHLTLLLSDKWLDDDIVDMMMFELATCVQLNLKLSRTTVIATLTLQTHINRAVQSGNYRRTEVLLLSRYTELFKKKQRTYLFFPAHINSNHWVAFFINFEKETLCYGEQ